MEYSTTTQDALKQRRRQATLRRQKQVRRQRICLVALLLFAGAGKEHTIDLSEEVSKSSIPAFLQWDERWGYETYGSDFLRRNTKAFFERIVK